MTARKPNHPLPPVPDFPLLDPDFDDMDERVIYEPPVRVIRTSIGRLTTLDREDDPNEL